MFIDLGRVKSTPFFGDIMIDKLLIKIADWHNLKLRQKNIINDKNYSDKDYCFRMNLYNIIGFIFMLLIGIIFKCFKEIALIFIVFNILREQCGGYHSYGNLTYCLGISTLVLLFIAKFSQLYSFNIFPLVLLTIFSIVYTFLKTPKLNLQYDKAVKYSWEYKIDFLIFALLFFIISFFLPNSLQISIYLTEIIIAIFMNNKIAFILNKIRGRIFDEKN